MRTTPLQNIKYPKLPNNDKIKSRNILQGGYQYAVKRCSCND